MSNSYCCPCETGLKCEVVENQSEIVAKSFILHIRAWELRYFKQEKLVFSTFLFCNDNHEKKYCHLGCVIDTGSNLYQPTSLLEFLTYR